jgi:hypothetical protein
MLTPGEPVISAVTPTAVVPDGHRNVTVNELPVMVLAFALTIRGLSAANALSGSAIATAASISNPAQAPNQRRLDLVAR